MIRYLLVATMTVVGLFATCLPASASNTGALGKLRVELLTAEGSEIPGFTAADAEVVQKNSTHAEVFWKGNKDVKVLQGKQIRLRFIGSRAQLFSFYFL